jgi:muramoyltetrapeptide carboxypeptidase LdcA involved in peptidoglycan recycling
MTQVIRDVILERTKAYRFPIVSDMDFGHTAPQFTLPVGCQGRIDSQKRQFEIIEPAVA